MKTWIRTLLSPWTSSSERNCFRFSEVESLSFKSWELSVLFSSPNYPPQRKPCSIRPSVGTPLCPSSSALQPALRLHFWLFSWAHEPTFWRAETLGLNFVLGCVCTCVRCSVFCGVSLQPLPSVGVFSICLGTTEYQQPRLFVQFSAKNGFKCYFACSTLGRPQWWTGTNPLTHALHLPSGADKIKYEGGERSGILRAFCAELMLSPPYAFSGLLVLPGSPAPHFGPPAGEGPAWVSRGAWGCLSDTEKGLENVISCHFGCLFFNIDILQFLLFFFFWPHGTKDLPSPHQGSIGSLES